MFKLKKKLPAGLRSAGSWNAMIQSKWKSIHMRSLSLLPILIASCQGNPSTLKIKGSDTEVNLVVKLAEQYRNVEPGFFVSISGGGSGLGIASLLNGQADMANSSRLMNEVEDSLFHERRIGLDTFIFAEDAIAFVVAEDLPLDSLDGTSLAKILDGTYSNWSSVTNIDRPINIYGRQGNSGTHEFIRKKLGIAFTPKAREMTGNAQILEALQADHSGIGYVGAGYMMSKGRGGHVPLKVLRISQAAGWQAFSPLDSSAVYSHRYFFQRHLYQYILTRSLPKASAFIDFEKSMDGARIIREEGYYPIHK
jgi:phosphate transport system substrate-binding protein